jgi:hypothetical protein
VDNPDYLLPLLIYDTEENLNYLLLFLEHTAKYKLTPATARQGRGMRTG